MQLEQYSMTDAMPLDFSFSGISAAEAEQKFIEMASHLDTYGVDPHPVKVMIPPRIKLIN